MKKLNVFLSSLFLFVFFLSIAGAEQTEIRVLYVNDFHGFAEPYKPLGSGELTGGIAYLASAAEQLRKEKPSILLAAGDMIQGNNWANLFQGEPVVQVMNVMGFDAMVVGNHEFDFGQDVLKKRISEAHFPVLGANVEGYCLLKPYVIKEINNVRIAVIGIVTEDAPVSTHPRNVAGLKFLPPSDVVKKYLRDLKGKADVFIVLSHIGYYADRNLAENVKGIDIIVGGHSHTKLDQPVVIGNTIIVQAWEHAKALGMLDLTIENGKIVNYDGHLDEINPRLYKPDPSVQEIVESYNRKLDGVLNEVIGEAAFDLDGENVREKETNLGDLIADIIRQESGADLAIINGGSIRTSIKKGGIRVEDVYSVLPFDNYIVAIKITGRQIKEALEHGDQVWREAKAGSPRFQALCLLTVFPGLPVRGLRKYPFPANQSTLTKNIRSLQMTSSRQAVTDIKPLEVL